MSLMTHSPSIQQQLPSVAEYESAAFFSCCKMDAVLPVKYSYVTLSFRPTNNQTNGSIAVTFHGFGWSEKILLFPWSSPEKLYRNTNGDTCFVTAIDVGYSLTDAIFVSLEFIPNSPISHRSHFNGDEDDYEMDEPIYENIEDLIADVCLISLEVEEFESKEHKKENGEPEKNKNGGPNKKQWILYQGQNLRANQIVTVTSSAFV